MLETIIFIFTRSRPFPTCFYLERSHNRIFFSFFCYFLEFTLTGRVVNDLNDNFYCHSFSAFPNLFWLEKKRVWCFFIFLIFLLFFLEFSIKDWVGNDRDDNFYFRSFSTFSNQFWLEKKRLWCFLVFWIFFAIFFFNSLLGVG